MEPRKLLCVASGFESRSDVFVCEARQKPRGWARAQFPLGNWRRANLPDGATQTALRGVGIWKPEPYASLSANGTKGEHGEAGSRAARVNEPTCDQVPVGGKVCKVTQENYETAGHFLDTIMVTISPPRSGAVFYKNSVPKSMKFCISA